MGKPLEPRAFGDDYIPKSKLARIENNRVYGGKMAELAAGSAKQLCLDRFNIALFNVDGRFYATKDSCPHASYPLSKGKLCGTVVTCASHSWQFDVATGNCVKGEGGESPTLRLFSVTIEGDDIWITLN